MLLKGKNILITGASSGLGEQFVKILYENGANKLAIAARRVDRLQYLSKELQGNHGNHAEITCINMDVANVSSIRSGFDEIESKWKS
jgi:short-subunit dehydrogenase